MDRRSLWHPYFEKPAFWEGFLKPMELPCSVYFLKLSLQIANRLLRGPTYIGHPLLRNPSLCQLLGTRGKPFFYPAFAIGNEKRSIQQSMQIYSPLHHSRLLSWKPLCIPGDYKQLMARAPVFREAERYKRRTSF